MEAYPYDRSPPTLTTSQRAIKVFQILGDKAGPAIPELTRLAVTLTDRELYQNCIAALSYTGNDSIPSFLTILTNARPTRRCFAMQILAAYGTNATPLLPAVIQNLCGTNERLGWETARILSQLQVPDVPLIPALTNALPTASPKARWRIISCLHFRQPRPRDAVPALLAALTDTNYGTRVASTNALRTIAPELLNNIPPK